MFAFAIWDKNARTLFCARDRLGKKPFYYYWDGRAVRLRLRNQGAARSIRPSRRSFEESLLPEYLAFGYMQRASARCSRGIRKLMPGHHLTLDLAAATRSSQDPRNTGNSRSPRPTKTRDDASWIAECRDRLEETVRMRLMSDVPLGMFLSGGVDSSAIAALMKRNVRRAGQDLRRGLPGSRIQRTCLRPPGRRAASAPSTTKSSSAWTISSTPCRG